MYNIDNLNLISEVLTNGYKNNSLSILSVLAIFFGISVIIAKNPIVSVLFLISLFCIIASYLIILGMHFIGISYLLVYVGAISILFLFILMLINVRISELVTDNKNSIPLALLIGLVFIISIYTILPHNIYLSDIIKSDTFYYVTDLIFNSNSVKNASNDISYLGQSLDGVVYVTSKLWDGNLLEMSHITGIGNVMYSNVLIWLIVTSLILLLSMIGVIIVTKK